MDVLTCIVFTVLLHQLVHYLAPIWVTAHMEKKKKKRNCSCSDVYFCGMSFLTRHHQKDCCYQCSNTSHSLMKQEKIHRAVPGTKETLAFHQFQG